MALAQPSRRRSMIPRFDRRSLLGLALAALAALLVLRLTSPDITVPVLVAAADIQAGEPLDAGMIANREVRSSTGLIEGESLGDLAGWTLAVHLATGEPLLASLLRPPQLREAGSMISVGVERSHAVLGRLAAGDIIDIYVTWPTTLGDDPVTELLASDLFVVEVSAPNEARLADEEVSLVLAVDDSLAPQIARASRSGELDLVKVGP